MRTRGYFKRPADRPLVSVITVVFNGAASLGETVQSVLAQDKDYVEYIVIDGGSSDGTLGILGKYENEIDYWLSEPDRGIYDAMNKGVSAATGDYILFLGADDVFASKTVISRIFGEMTRPPLPDLVFGNVRYQNGRHFRSRFSPLIKLKNRLHHQGVFCHKRMFDNFRFDPRFTISADYDLSLKLYVSGVRALQTDLTIAICGDRGISSRCLWTGYAQEIVIRHKYLSFLEAVVYDAQTILRFAARKMALRAKRILRCFTS